MGQLRVVPRQPRHDCSSFNASRSRLFQRGYSAGRTSVQGTCSTCGAPISNYKPLERHNGRLSAADKDIRLRATSSPACSIQLDTSTGDKTSTRRPRTKQRYSILLLHGDHGPAVSERLSPRTNQRVYGASNCSEQSCSGAAVCSRQVRTQRRSHLIRGWIIFPVAGRSNILLGRNRSLLRSFQAERRRKCELSLGPRQSKRLKTTNLNRVF